jgi:DNA-binding response OmpR family regulator
VYTIFVVEDDQPVRDELLTLLSHNGFEVKTSDDYANMVEAVLAAAPDLLILDLTLPEVDGQVICREVRRQSTLPILIVTSRDNSLDELICMNQGADGYITKPYNPPILLAHVTSLLRRTYSDTGGPVLMCGGVSLEVARGQVSYGGKTVDLTKNELRILHLLMVRKGEIVSRQDIQNELWQSDEFVDDNTLTVNINRLRTTLSTVGVREGFVQTRRGQGYLIEE